MVTAAVLLATAQQDIEYIPVLSCSINSTLSRKCLVKHIIDQPEKDFLIECLNITLKNVNCKMHAFRYEKVMKIF